LQRGKVEILVFKDILTPMRRVAIALAAALWTSTATAACFYSTTIESKTDDGHVLVLLDDTIWVSFVITLSAIANS
jgi:hypothetical protein